MLVMVFLYCDVLVIQISCKSLNILSHCFPQVTIHLYHYLFTTMSAQALYNAANNGRVEEVRTLLAQGAPPQGHKDGVNRCEGIEKKNTVP